MFALQRPLQVIKKDPTLSYAQPGKNFFMYRRTHPKEPENLSTDILEDPFPPSRTTVKLKAPESPDEQLLKTKKKRKKTNKKLNKSNGFEKGLQRDFLRERRTSGLG